MNTAHDQLPGESERVGPLQAWIDSLNLEYKAEFVPQSQSRNAGNKNLSINWLVTVGAVTCEYSQGIEHLPGYKHGRKLVIEANAEKYAAENGRFAYPRNGRSAIAPKRLVPPTIADVLYSLVMDSSALEFPSFEDWASEFGYDSDSREAEKIYQDCLKTALKLRTVIDLDKAAEMFQDY